jgi:exportin-2 (importin alpha re-exporter)
MLQKYRDNPWENWRDKDTVLYLVTSLASKGQTQRHGTTQTNQLVDLTTFATEHILPELQKDTGKCLINHLYVMVFVSF